MDKKRQVIIVSDDERFIQKVKKELPRKDFKVEGDRVHQKHLAVNLVQKCLRSVEEEVIILLDYIIEADTTSVMPRHFSSLPHFENFVFFTIIGYPQDHPLFKLYTKGRGFNHFPTKDVAKIKQCLSGECDCEEVKKKMEEKN